MTALPLYFDWLNVSSYLMRADNHSGIVTRNENFPRYVSKTEHDNNCMQTNISNVFFTTYTFCDFWYLPRQKNHVRGTCRMNISIFDSCMLMYDNDVITETVLCDSIFKTTTINIVTTKVTCCLYGWLYASIDCLVYNGESLLHTRTDNLFCEIPDNIYFIKG